MNFFRWFLEISIATTYIFLLITREKLLQNNKRAPRCGSLEANEIRLIFNLLDNYSQLRQVDFCVSQRCWP